MEIYHINCTLETILSVLDLVLGNDNKEFKNEWWVCPIF